MRRGLLLSWALLAVQLVCHSASVSPQQGGARSLREDATPPSPDLTQQDEAMQQSSNKKLSAKAASAATSGGSAAKAIAKVAAASKASAAGEPPRKSKVPTKEQTAASEKGMSAEIKTASKAEEEEQKTALRKSGIPEEAIDKAANTDAVLTTDTETETAPAAQRADHTFVKFQKLIVPQGKVLMRQQGTLLECQNSCTRTPQCNGVEYSAQNQACILLRDGLRWSNTFDYYEKNSLQDLSPVAMTRGDSKLLWGRASAVENDLGGLEVGDVPGATLYRPPSKMKQARQAIRDLSEPIEAARIVTAAKAKQELQDVEAAQGNSVMTLDQTRSVQKKAAERLQATEARHATVDLRAAKLNLRASKLAAMASAKVKKYKHAKAKALEYSKASARFAAANNPLAASMRHKYLKWKIRTADLRRISAIAETRAGLLKIRAHTANSNSQNWKQQVQWATTDANTASKHLADAIRMKHAANQKVAQAAKFAKEAYWKANCKPQC
jgi:hypothetical protein